MALAKVVSKITGKTHTKAGTHSHYKEEFGVKARAPGKGVSKGIGQGVTKTVEQIDKKTADPHHRAGRAEHFAKKAQEAHHAHTSAKTDAERTKHEVNLAHAAHRATVHANFVKKTQPGSELSDQAALHAHTARHLHESLVAAKSEKSKRDESDKAEKSKRDEKERTDREKSEKDDKDKRDKALVDAHDAAAKAHNRLRDANNDYMDATMMADLDEAKKHVTHMRSLSNQISEIHSGVTTSSHDAVGKIAKMSENAKKMVQAAESDIHKLTHADISTPNINSFEYTKMSNEYATKLSTNERSAILNYSSHTDRILNPALRSSGGSPDTNQQLYSGDHAPKHVHEQRKEKRAVDMTTDHTVGAEIAELDRALSKHKIDRDVTVYRTMTDPGGKITGSLKEGDSFVDHGYSSMSTDKKFLDQFYPHISPNHADRVDMHVSVRSGSTIAPIGALSKYGNSLTGAGESEMLPPRGSRFRVTKVTDGAGGSREVHVELLQ